MYNDQCIENWSSLQISTRKIHIIIATYKPVILHWKTIVFKRQVTSAWKLHNGLQYRIKSGGVFGMVDIDLAYIIYRHRVLSELTNNVSPMVLGVACTFGQTTPNPTELVMIGTITNLWCTPNCWHQATIGKKWTTALKVFRKIGVLHTIERKP